MNGLDLISEQFSVVHNISHKRKSNQRNPNPSKPAFLKRPEHVLTFKRTVMQFFRIFLCTLHQYKTLYHIFVTYINLCLCYNKPVETAADLKKSKSFVFCLFRIFLNAKTQHMDPSFRIYMESAHNLLFEIWSNF